MRTILLFFLLASAAHPRTELPRELAACLHEANLANTALDVDRQRTLLLHAERLEGRPADAADVQRRLAVLDWKYDERPEAARSRLKKATGGAEAARAWLALSRMEYELKRFEAAGEAARMAAEVARKNEVRRAGGILHAKALMARGGERRRNGEPLDVESLETARDSMLAVLRDEPGLIVPSKILLRLAVLVGDGRAALTAWRSYYQVPESGAAPNAVASAGDTLAVLLPRLDDPAFTREEGLQLVEALHISHFSESAALLALDPRFATDAADAPDARSKEALAYADFVIALRDGVADYYRAGLRRGDDPPELDRIFRTHVQTLHAALDDGTPAPRSTTAQVKWLEKRFGVHANLGITSGFYDLHMGHVVIDETRRVEQYGISADLRFVALDHMISNGFESWAWETGAEHGGWAGPNTMWQVRPLYVDGVIDGWRQMNDPVAHERILAGVARASAGDDERARANPVAHLPGLLGRLRIQAAEQLLEELREQGHEGKALREAFIEELTDSIIQHSIFAHEGRHAIDQNIGEFDPATMEYRAKLSQLAFASRPRLAIPAIVSPVTGSPTPHGQANVRVLEGVLRWMRENADRIEGLDGSRPLLPQLDLLTDDQLRTMARSMDPLAERVHRSGVAK